MKIAVVLFNLGGPDGPEAVRPFLYNLFCDPAIIRLPWGLRHFVAWMIARKRAPIAREIYAKIGGRSPILPNTEAQARALEAALADMGSVKCFIAMRYWHPFTAAAARDVAAFAPDMIVRLPLYPQFSTTTTGSSFVEFSQSYGRNSVLRSPPSPNPSREGRGVFAAFLNSVPPPSLGRLGGGGLRNPNPIKTICCYPQESGFIAAMARNIRAAYDTVKQRNGQAPRVLFSAHGLPEKIIAAGDPYQAQCEMTAQALAAALAIEGLDWVLCYQSRVGPLQWIKPATDTEILRAGADKVPLVIAPIAFVSEHSETLVEIAIEYKHLAQQNGVPDFASVPTVGTAPEFIDGLARLVRQAVATDTACTSERPCTAGQRGCWRKDNPTSCRDSRATGL